MEKSVLLLLDGNKDFYSVRLECGCIAIVQGDLESIDDVYCPKPNHSGSHAINWRRINPSEFS